MEKTNDKKGNGLALFTFAIFVIIYLLSRIILQIKGVEMTFY